MGIFKIEPCRSCLPGCMNLVFYSDEGVPLRKIIVNDAELKQLKTLLK